MKNTATIKKNALFNGIEIYFDGKPGADVIARLKEELRARWHSAKKCWYFKDTPENARTAAEIVGQADAHAQSDAHALTRNADRTSQGDFNASRIANSARTKIAQRTKKKKWRPQHALRDATIKEISHLLENRKNTC